MASSPIFSHDIAARDFQNPDPSRSQDIQPNTPSNSSCRTYCCGPQRAWRRLTLCSMGIGSTALTTGAFIIQNWFFAGGCALIGAGAFVVYNSLSHDAALAHSDTTVPDISLSRTQVRPTTEETDEVSVPLDLNSRAIELSHECINNLSQMALAFKHTAQQNVKLLQQNATLRSHIEALRSQLPPLSDTDSESRNRAQRDVPLDDPEDPRRAADS